MADKEKPEKDKESWRKNLLSGILSSKKEEKADDHGSEEWKETCDKVFRNDEFSLGKLSTTDAAQIDVGARAYRKPSIHDDPIPAPEPLKLSAAALEDTRKVRTVLPGVGAVRALGAAGAGIVGGTISSGKGSPKSARKDPSDASGGLPYRRINTVSGDLSEYSVHKEEGFPRIHHVMSRKLHRWGSRGEADQSSPPTVSAISSIPPRNRKISTGPGMPTIEDEDIANIVDDVVGKTGTEMFSTSHDESESESDVDRLPWHIRRPSQFSAVSDHETDEPTTQESKVKFGQPETETETEADAEASAHATDKSHAKKKHRKKKYHSHRRKSQFTEDELHQRWARGSELPTRDPGLNTEEDLENRDRAAIASHRMDPLTGLSMHKISRAASITPAMLNDLSKAAKMNEVLTSLEYDRTPHDIFVEMDELKDNEWQEQSRWIKYEEDLLEGAERWGKAHISSLTFHSLINLRLVLEKCVLLLDFDARDYHSVVYRLVEEFGVNDDLSEEVKVEVLRTLLLPHKYVDGHNSNFKLGDLKRSFSRSSLRGSFKGEEGPRHSTEPKIKWLRQFSKQESAPNFETLAQSQSLLNHNEKRNSSHIISMKETNRRQSGKDSDQLVVNVGEDGFPTTQSFTELYRLATAQRRDNIMSKLEEGTEGTMTMVGALESLKKPLVGLVRLSHGIIMPNLMEVPVPVRFIFVLFTQKPSPNMDCHEVGRSFSTLMSNKKFQRVCYGIEERQDLLNSINNFLDETVVLPPGDWSKRNLLSMSEIQELKRKKRLRLEAMAKLKQDKGVIKTLLDIKHKKDPEVSDKSEKEEKGEKEEKEEPPQKAYDPLDRTNMPFGGVINEIKTRAPKFLSDITDCLSPMCIAAVIFIFFAALSGAIAFGGLYGDKTEGYIGIPETLITSAVSGCLFALFSGQPIVIIGVTGPVMVYDEALFKFSKSAEVEYLPWRVWISFWTLIIALIVAAFQGSFVVKYFTKFTKDIFASFIATVFIIEALMKTAAFFRDHPPMTLIEYCTKPDISEFLRNISSTNDFNDTSPANHTIPESDHPFKIEPNTAFKSFILQFCTFWIAYYLRIFRNGKALGRTIRRALGDFGVPIAIVIMVGVDMAFPKVFTQKLNVPAGLDVTSPLKREWFISPLGINDTVPIWIPFISALPAILLYLLLFMETSICELILMDKCKKGSGLHWDVVLLSILNVPGALFGGPWICAATVRAIAHLSALTVMSTTHAPGESPKVVEVRDQRVTGFFVSLLVGLSVLLSPLLRLVPNAVIFGVFLYMGISSLGSIQFFDRLWLMFMPVKHHPNISYVRRVRTWKMHLFTVVQGLGLGILWIVKSTPAALVFPFFVVFQIPLRLCLKFFFTPKELEALDGPNAGSFVHDEEDEPDFYAQGIGG